MSHFRLILDSLKCLPNAGKVSAKNSSILEVILSVFGGFGEGLENVCEILQNISISFRFPRKYPVILTPLHQVDQFEVSDLLLKMICTRKVLINKALNEERA